jgi:hypothetical protein
MEIVVSRYKESIDWTKNLPYKVHVYNKGGDALEGTIPLENIGREAHTYLHFLVENYENLPEYTVFLQGDPFDHIGPVLPLQEWHACLMKKGYTPNLTAVSVPAYFHEPRPDVKQCPLTLGEWSKEHIGEGPEFPHLLMYIGACFGVRKDFILSRPREYYKNLLDQHTACNPDEAYFMERMWVYVFNVHRRFTRRVD